MHGILVLSLGCTVTPGELSKILLSSNTRNYDLITWGMVLGERMFKISMPPTPCQPGNFTLQPRLRPVCSMCMRAQLCPALCNLMDCSLSGSSVLGISQARILESVAFHHPGDLDPGIELVSPALQADSLLLCHLGIPPLLYKTIQTDGPALSSL